MAAKIVVFVFLFPS